MISRDRALHRPARRSRAVRGLLVLAAAAVLSACAMADEPERVLTFDGPEADTLVGAGDLDVVSVTVSAAFEGDGDEADADPPIDDLAVLLDGDDVTADAVVDGATLTYAPDALADGTRTITIVSRPVSDGSGDADEGDAGDADGDAEELASFTVEVDATPPELTLTAPEGPLVAGDPVSFVGTTEPGANVQVGDESATADDAGGFEVALPAAPQGPVTLVSTDRAGNTTQDEASFVVVPSRATVDEVRSVHVSFCGWASPTLREPVLELIDDGLINAVQLDLKDETGKVGYDTDIEFAAQIGSDSPDCSIDLQAAIAELHGLGVPVIGRIVAFADPVLAPWAWANGQPDLAILNADASDIYTGRYNGFANFTNPEVVEYNIGIAEEAAAMGVDHILWDYLRKPDGPIENMTVRGLEGSVEDAIVDFTRQADERLAPYGIQHGASLYGVSADRPWEVGQDVERLGELLDYVSPMIYPSHWGANEYGVANPLMQPQDMIEATLEVWLEVTDGRRARVVPWLEDSNWPIRLGYPDRADYVREQLEGTYARGINEWLLWDSSVNYTRPALIQPGA